MLTLSLSSNIILHLIWVGKICEELEVMADLLLNF